MANGKGGSKADQHARFLETARQLGCDEDEAAFDEKLKAVVGPKHPQGDKQLDGDG